MELFSVLEDLITSLSIPILESCKSWQGPTVIAGTTRTVWIYSPDFVRVTDEAVIAETSKYAPCFFP